MKFRHRTCWLMTGLLCLNTASSFGSESSIEPVTPNASRQARALLQFIYGISGKHTLTGQHNYPDTKDASTLDAAKHSGKTPAVYSQDWGFAKDGDKDAVSARPDIVKECIRQHKLGSIITICWHAVPPTADEPVTFRPRRDANAPDGKLASVQGQLADKQFDDVLTPGTQLHEHWCSQVDTIASFLKQLQDANVPVLWRPYHEMNGDWFWWGGRRGDRGTATLYRQMFERLVNHHKLNNLIWVWSVDRPEHEDRQFKDYFPGDGYFDIASLDCYGEFKQSYYDDLLKIAAGKPIVLGEVGRPPTLEVLEKQPKWALYVIWAGMVRMTKQEQLQELVNNPRMLSLEDTAYIEAIALYRSACGLPPLKAEDYKSM